MTTEDRPTLSNPPSFLSLTGKCSFLLVVLLLAGCMSNPFISFEYPEEVYPSGTEAGPPSDESLVIEIVDSGPDSYTMAEILDVGGDFVDMRVARWGNYQKSFVSEKILESKEREALRAAKVALIKEELRQELLRKFPNASVIMPFEDPASRIAKWRRWENWSRFGETDMSIPYSSMGGSVNFFLELPTPPPEALPIADVVVYLDYIQGMNPEDGAYAGLSFGRYYNLEADVWLNGSEIRSFNTNYGDRTPAKSRERLEAFRTEPTPSERKAVAKSLNDRLVGPTLDLYEDLYEDYPGNEAAREKLVDLQARLRKIDEGDHTYWHVRFAATETELENYTEDLSTAPLLPVYRRISEAVEDAVADTDAASLRGKLWREWASFYTTDEAVLENRTVGSQGDQVRRARRILSKLREKEIEYLEKVGNYTTTLLATGEVGAGIRKALLEQNNVLDGYQNRLLLANVTALGGSLFALSQVGTAAAASANVVGNSTIQFGTTIISSAQETSAQASKELTDAIADKVGPIQFAFDDFQTELKAGTYAELRSEFKGIYDKLMKKKSGDGADAANSPIPSG